MTLQIKIGDYGTIKLCKALKSLGVRGGVYTSAGSTQCIEYDYLRWQAAIKGPLEPTIKSKYKRLVFEAADGEALT